MRVGVRVVWPSTPRRSVEGRLKAVSGTMTRTRISPFRLLSYRQVAYTVTSPSPSAESRQTEVSEPK